MNRIVLVGRLTKDPEMKIFEETKKMVAKFILAVERPFKNSEGERETDFIPVAFWGKKAEVISKHFEKGRLISITGRLQTGSYEDKDGKKIYVAEIIADEFQFIDGKKVEEVV